jgi:two-component system chemotaxis response regulator CheY
MVRLYYRSALTSAGFEIEDALNGLEALEKVMRAAPDLLIVDVNMPRMDGFSFLRSLRAHPSEIAGIPALVITTEAAESDRDAAFTAGANFFLVKPVPVDDLLLYARMLTGAK